jgi:hypothetical protein
MLLSRILRMCSFFFSFTLGVCLSYLSGGMGVRNACWAVERDGGEIGV